MRIFIITMEDPVYTMPFLKEVIDARGEDIIGVATAKGDRLKIGKQRSKYVYLISLLLIMGVPYFLKYSWITMKFKLGIKLHAWGLSKESPSILHFARKKSIKTFELGSPNSKKFLDELKALEPDIIIHQSQNIVKSELLSVPKIGTLNRHNALLPKNRGRLTPFWVLFKKEKETGVSIHFVEEGLDSGPIIVQERFEVPEGAGFNQIVKRNYEIAPKAMLKAIDLLEEGHKDFIGNPDEEATYNTVPSFSQAFKYRLNRLVS